MRKKMNTPKDYSATYEYVETGDARVRSERICNIVKDALRRKIVVNMNGTVCFCFNYSETDIEQDA